MSDKADARIDLGTLDEQPMFGRKVGRVHPSSARTVASPSNIYPLILQHVWRARSVETRSAAIV